MEVEIFTICDFSQVVGGKLFINGVFDILGAKNFPCKHPHFSVACRLRFGEDELGKHELQIKFIDPDKDEFLKSFKGSITIVKPLVGNVGTINIPMNLGNVEFKKTGKHVIELYVDEECITGLYLNVVKGPQPGQ